MCGSRVTARNTCAQLTAACLPGVFLVSCTVDSPINDFRGLWSHHHGVGTEPDGTRAAIYRPLRLTSNEVSDSASQIARAAVPVEKRRVVGKISWDQEDLLGFGAFGTCVFRGRWDDGSESQDVAMKNCPN